MILSAAVPAQAELKPELITLPPGFKIDVYAENIENARSMALSPNGILYVGTRTAGKVYAVLDKDKDHHADQIITLVQGWRAPNGVAFHDGALYVAEVSRVWRFSDIDNQVDKSPKASLLRQDFPTDAHHGWKFIAFGPDGKLYIPVGAPCNVCEKGDVRYASIMRINPDGSDPQLFARGIRNTVGFDWDPQTKELWFTDNGRDMLGDDMPPDELNHAPKQGMHFGFPYCHGRSINDPEFGKMGICRQFTPPAQELGAHVAALGMRFYTGGMFPEEYRNQIFIAEHGSWNRSTKLGYRIMLVRVKDNNAASYEVFAEGWKQGEEVWGRPVDILVMPDGSLLVSDDHAGAIYRITYEK